MNIAIAQMQSVAGAFDETRTRMLSFAQRAKDEGADLVLFPAHVLTGGCAVDEADQEGFVADLIQTLQSFAEEVPVACAIPIAGTIGGMPLFDVALVRDGAVHPLRMEAEFEAFKRGLFGSPDEDDDSAAVSFEMDGMRIAVAFTFEELDALCSAGHVYDLVVYASTYGFCHDNPSTQLAAALTESRFISDAERTGAWLAAVGPLGVYDTQVFPGASFVLAPWGELAAEAPSFEEALVTCAIDPAAEGPLPHALAPDVPDRLLTLMSALIEGLTGFCRAEGIRDAALVMDGSLISSVVATLACDALGPMNVHAIVGGAATPELHAAALELATRLHVDATVLSEGASSDDAELARARLVRTSGALPLINLDKTGAALEMRMGALEVGGLAPLGDVYRSDVVALARLRNTISPVIPAASMRAWKVPPVEGMTARYITGASQLEFVDYVLSGRIEWGRSYTQIVEEDRGGELAERILELLRIRRTSRLAAPRVLIVSSQSLMEFPQPFGMRWHDRVREDGGQDWEQLGSYLQSLAAPHGSQTSAAMQRELRDSLSYLRDLAMSGELFGGLGLQNPSGKDPSHRQRPGDGGDAWPFGGLFSDN